MTEILNEELDTNEGGFSRRRVVKGVAWTLPVLVTAVGAPPASASPGSPTISFVNAGSAITYSQGNRTGTGPTAIRITGATGSISGSVIIAPAATVNARIGIQPAASSGFSASTFTGNTSTTPFVATAVVGKALDIPVSFFNLEDGPPNKPKPNDVYTYTLSVQLNGGQTSAPTNLTITFR